MRLILIILCVFIGSAAFSQPDTIPNIFSENDTSTSIQEMVNDTCLSQDKIIKIALEIQELRRRVNVQSNIIATLETELKQTRKLNNQNESILALQKREIAIYEGITDRFQNLHMPSRKWYESQEFNFIMGALVGGATIYLGGQLNK